METKTILRLIACGVMAGGLQAAAAAGQCEGCSAAVPTPPASTNTLSDAEVADLLLMREEGHLHVTIGPRMVYRF